MCPWSASLLDRSLGGYLTLLNDHMIVGLKDKMALTNTLLSLYLFLMFVSTVGSLPRLSIERNKSFRLKTTIQVHFDISQRSRYQVEESYSRGQRRTKVDYKSLSPTRDAWLRSANIPARGKFIIDDEQASAPLLINESDGVWWCHQESWSNFLRLLQLDFIADLSAHEKGQKPTGMNIYGPSSVLFMLDEIKDQLEKDEHRQVSVRNIPAVMFQHPSNHHMNSTQIFVYYAKTRLDDLEALPLRVVFDFSDGRSVQFEFRALQPAHNNLEGEQWLARETNLNFDEFFINRGIGCSKRTQAEAARSDFVTSPFGSVQSFSFNARFFEHQSGSQVLAQVAYHGPINSMRINRESNVRSSQILLDFSLGQTYQKLTQTRVEDSLMNEILSTSDDTADSCIVVRSPKTPKVSGDGRNLMAELLTGSSDFLYLGLAQVRGQWTKAYEAYNTTWPHWLKQPVSYTRNWFHDEPNQEIVHEAYDDLRKGIVLNIVFYLQLDEETTKRDNVSNILQVERGRLVHMEIFRIEDATHRRVDSMSISFYDFSWQVNKFGHLTKTSDIFSLADECFAPTDLANQSSELFKVISIRLVGESSVQTKWLHDSHLRDLSLIEGLQNQLELPSSFIHDLSSRFTPGLKESTYNPFAVNLAFRLIKNQPNLVKLHYYGRGRAKKLYRFRLRNLPAENLRVCYFVAARLKTNIFFGYSEQNSLCLVDSQVQTFDVVARSKFIKSEAFDIFTNGPMDIYFVQHDEDRALKLNDNLISKLLQSVAASHSAIANSQLSKKLQLVNPVDVNSKTSLVVRNFNIDNFDSHQSQPFKIDDVSVSNTNKFLGFALVPNGNLCKSLVLEDKGVQIISVDFHSCKMACLMDLDCKSYSFCLRGSRAECVLSGADFKSPHLKLQLIDVIQTRNTGGELPGLNGGKIHSLRAPGDKNERVEVREQLGCELHNKLYLELFHRSERRLELKSNSISLQVQPVERGYDQCAQICFEQTLKVVNESEDFTQTIKSNLDRIISNYDRLAQDSYQTIEAISGLQHRASKKFCKEFYYLDAINLSTVPSNLARMFRAPAVDAENSGYCITRSAQDRTDEDKSSQIQAYKDSENFMNVEQFSFKFETLYERQRGLTLTNSNRTSEELKVYNYLKLKIQRPRELKDLQLLRDLIERQENSQDFIVMSHMDETLCATACALQMRGTWPSCKSFDLVVLSSGYNKSTMTICRMNSITYKEVLDSGREDLVRYEDSITNLQWHYEPKWHMDASRVPSNNSLELDGSNNHAASVALVTFISSIGLMSGLMLGIAVAARCTRDKSPDLLKSDVDEGDLSYDLTILDLQRT